MPTSCLRCARWGTCICCGTSCCFWHQHSPAAKIADHERAAEAGHDGKKTNSSASTGMLNTQRLKDTGLFRVSLAGRPNGRDVVEDRQQADAAGAVVRFTWQNR